MLFFLRREMLTTLLKSINFGLSIIYFRKLFLPNTSRPPSSASHKPLGFNLKHGNFVIIEMSPTCTIMTDLLWFFALILTPSKWYLFASFPCICFPFLCNYSGQSSAQSCTWHQYITVASMKHSQVIHPRVQPWKGSQFCSYWNSLRENVFPGTRFLNTSLFCGLAEHREKVLLFLCQWREIKIPWNTLCQVAQINHIIIFP